MPCWKRSVRSSFVAVFGLPELTRRSLVAKGSGGFTWRELYYQARERLHSEQEARWILEEATGRPFGELIEDLDQLAKGLALERFDEMTRRRSEGWPLQYVLGHWTFRSLELRVTPAVLIPRPETEILVEVALSMLPVHEECAALDLGTGSGAVAFSIALERPRVRVWATDEDPAALAVARSNLAGLGRPATRVRLLQGDWYGALPKELRSSFDLVVSNPPYVSEPEWEELSLQVKDFEPRRALVAGEKGTEDLEVVISGAPNWLRSGGALAVELAPWQAGEMAAFARKVGFTFVEVHKDLSERQRILVARL
jgi:release factor glutamine methyltransferase